MVSINKIGGETNGNILEIYGLSTDIKPEMELQGHKLLNSSSYYEMDTKKAYLYDETNHIWIAQ